ncbi:MAG: penicillin-binding transpeptidase domain-containing protein [Desulfurispora sp.]|uniref:penicillin-binding transpeptidase domain-containing protein n=1 Tax=Desulfurispora sp. TaxID=3014275 RepID=UPI00404ABEAA
MAQKYNPAPRLAAVAAVAALLFAFLLLRLIWVQIWQGEKYRARGEQIRVHDEELRPSRGTIFDRNMRVLTRDVPVSSVYVNADIFSVRVGKGEDAGEKNRRVREEMAALLQIPLPQLSKQLDSKQPFVWLKHQVDVEAVEKLKKLPVTGLGFVPGSRRDYPERSLAAGLLGVVGLDNQGLSGLESSYESELKGTVGHLVVEYDAQGREMPQTRTRYIAPRPGHSLVLTVDQTIQYFVEKALDTVMAEHRPARAAILVMEPQTGAILAMGERPTFDPANWQKYPGEVWGKNLATTYTYEPGSTFKMFTAAAALEEGLVNENTTFNCPGYAVVSKRRIHNWDRKGHGLETFAEGIQNSCNSVFVQTGQRLGRERFYKYVRGFGFGMPLGVDFASEEHGIVIPENSASELNVATMAIGQSLAVTPLQLLRAVCAVANGGYLMRPLLVQKVLDEQGKVLQEYRPEVVRQVISSDTSRQLSRLLTRVVLEGSGKKAYVDGYLVAGKTGTAQVPGPQGYEPGKYVSSFAGFVPADDPRIAVLVMVAEPSRGQYYGGEVAAPVFHQVARDTLRYLQVPEKSGLPRPKNYGPPAPDEPAVPVGPEKIAVPDLVGYSLTMARERLQQVGLQARVEKNGGSLVTGQQPGPGYLVAPGTAVSLRLAALPSGEAAVLKVPDLRGLTMRQAGVLLEELGFLLEPLGSGLAVRQEPRAGSSLVRGSRVKVEFAPPG